MTLERDIRPAGKYENYTQMAKTKGRWQKSKTKLKQESIKLGKKQKRRQHIQAKNRTGQK